MIKNFNIPVEERVQLFQIWLASINWTLGPNQLTQAELEILSYFIYYNDKYRSIKENDVRMDLLFSTTIKSKIKKEFNINTHKLETYLNKLRKKNVIENNSINERFIIYPEQSLQVQFNSSLQAETPQEDIKPANDKPTAEVNEPIQPIEVEDSSDSTSSVVDDLDEVDPQPFDPRSDFDKYFNEEPPLESWM
jgi:hypothetical protein